MSADPASPPPPRRTQPTYAAAWTGAAASAIILALAALGLADLGPAVMGAVLVAGVAAWQTTRALRRYRFITLAQGRATASAPERAPPFGKMFDAFPDPALLVSTEIDDLGSRRIVVANLAARELLRIPREGARLVSALRHPEVLEAVDESLFGGLTRSAAWESSGAQDRVWRAWSTPLGGADGERLALLVIHEETDARRADRTRADFMANASHELRTPLASLSGFIETLRGHAKSDEAARERFLRIMALQAQRMARLVDDLLSLSRIELNEHIPPAGVLDLRMAVVDVCDALAPQAREQQVGIDTRLPRPGEALITGERDQIVQIVQNLVDNAMKYSAAGDTVRVEMATDLDADDAALAGTPGGARLSLLTPDRSPHRYVSVRVTDTGPGIAREHLPRLTERFYRVEGQKSGERPGTGLGLSIVKHVANRHRGGFAVESTLGAGSTFIVYFPMLDAKLGALAAGAREPPPAAREGPEPVVATKLS